MYICAIFFTIKTSNVASHSMHGYFHQIALVQINSLNLPWNSCFFLENPLTIVVIWVKIWLVKNFRSNSDACFYNNL